MFDLVIAQDVFEHVLNPAKAFREIARTLKPGEVHLFTVPWYYWQKTRIRAMEKDGKIEHVLPPEYHGNPISADGSLGDNGMGIRYAGCYSQEFGPFHYSRSYS